jgi:hypothetical protein
VITTTESAGANCTTGGVKLEYGLDANANGVLDAEEINATLTKYICNGATGTTGATGLQGPAGATGTQGPAGTNGTNGTNGQNSLVITTTESAGANCTTGGVKLEYGLDANANGVLDAGEINAALTKYICNGATGTTGATGPQGTTGATGAVGPQGPTGPAWTLVNTQSMIPYFFTSTTRATITVNVTGSSDRVMLNGQFDFAKDATSSWVSLEIWRNGAEIVEGSGFGTLNQDSQVNIQWTDQPGVGTHTYELKSSNGAGGFSFIYGSSIRAVVVKP